MAPSHDAYFLVIQMGKIWYVMDACRYSRLTVKRELVCPKCGKYIYVGDRVLSNTCNSSAKVYHAECFESYYI